MPASIFDSTLAWVSSGLLPGAATSLFGTGFSTLVSGAPAFAGASVPPPNAAEQVQSLTIASPSFRLANETALNALAGVRDLNGNVIVPTSSGLISFGQGQNLSFDPDTAQGRVTPAIATQTLSVEQSSPDGGMYSFTGSDMRAIIELGDTPRKGNTLARYAKQMVELTTLSVSIHRVQSPVRACGYVGVKGFARGGRTIAGTMVMTQFTVDVLMSFLQSTLMSDRSKDTSFMKIDQLPPFNISIVFANEHGFISYRRLLGVVFVTDGTTYSVQDLLSEQTVSYMAADFTTLLPLNYSNLFDPSTLPDPSFKPERTPRDLMQAVGSNDLLPSSSTPLTFLPS